MNPRRLGSIDTQLTQTTTSHEEGGLAVLMAIRVLASIRIGHLSGGESLS